MFIIIYKDTLSPFWETSKKEDKQVSSENIGLNLRRLRLMRNLSQEELAQKIGGSRDG